MVRGSHTPVKLTSMGEEVMRVVRLIAVTDQGGGGGEVMEGEKDVDEDEKDEEEDEEEEEELLLGDGDEEEEEDEEEKEEDDENIHGRGRDGRQVASHAHSQLSCAAVCWIARETVAEHATGPMRCESLTSDSLSLSARFNHPLQPGSIPHRRRAPSSRLRIRPAATASCPARLTARVGCQCLLQATIAAWQFAVWAENARISRAAVRVSAYTAARCHTCQCGGGEHEQKVQSRAGGIPATVRWMRLPRNYAKENLSRVLSPPTRVCMW